MKKAKDSIQKALKNTVDPIEETEAWNKLKEVEIKLLEEQLKFNKAF